MSQTIQRSSGILLHPTSLPGPYGVGDLGPNAYAWVDRLAAARQTWWQVLPLGPTGFGDSPYQSFSSFAGNVNLISPDSLVHEGLLHADNLHDVQFAEGRADYLAANPMKLAILRRAWENFRSGHAAHLRDSFDAFKFDKRDWLDDYALFMAMKDARRGEPWYLWPTELVRRETGGQVLQFARDEMADEIGYQQFGQFLFFRKGFASSAICRSLWQAIRPTFGRIRRCSYSTGKCDRASLRAYRPTTSARRVSFGGIPSTIGMHIATPDSAGGWHD
jgi:4-alpha-glucanotransferase